MAAQVLRAMTAMPPSGSNSDGIAGGSMADSFRGLIYAPASSVTLSSSAGLNIGALVSANLAVVS